MYGYPVDPSPRINPESEEYCPRCDYDRHICPGCGDNLEHGIEVCDTCQGEVDRGER